MATQPDPVFYAIQPVRLFTRLIGDSQPFWANPRCYPNSYEKEIQWDSIKK